MGKHSRSVIGICDNDMQYSGLHKKHRDVDGDIIMYKLSNDGVIRAAQINTMLKGRKQVIEKSLHTFVTASCLVNSLIQAQFLIKSIQVHVAAKV